MRLVTAILASLALVSACPLSANAADGPPELSRNPFSRPSSEVIRSVQSVFEPDNGNSETLDLQATMIGSRNRLANVAGRILKPGDEIEGYRLVAVHERYAVFRRDSKMITVYVKPHLAEDDE
jgi:hypothetical protein